VLNFNDNWDRTLNELPILFFAIAKGNISLWKAYDLEAYIRYMCCTLKNGYMMDGSPWCLWKKSRKKNPPLPFQFNAIQLGVRRSFLEKKRRARQRKDIKRLCINTNSIAPHYFGFSNNLDSFFFVKHKSYIWRENHAKEKDLGICEKRERERERERK
jgi:hypothetical protein